MSLINDPRLASLLNNMTLGNVSSGYYDPDAAKVPAVICTKHNHAPNETDTWFIQTFKDGAKVAQLAISVGVEELKVASRSTNDQGMFEEWVMLTKPDLTADLIPELDASKITSGEFDLDRIPELDRDKVTSAQVADKWTESIDVEFTGDATSEVATLDGSENLSVALTLKDVVEGRSVGSKIKIPVLEVDDKGRIIDIGEEDIASGVLKVVNETIEMDAESSKVYDLASILGSDLELYDMDTVAVSALVINYDPESPTGGYSINSEAVITVGFSEDRSEVILHNDTPIALDVKVLITVGAEIATMLGLTGQGLMSADSEAEAREAIGLKNSATSEYTVSTDDPSGGSDGDIWYQVD